MQKQAEVGIAVDLLGPGQASFDQRRPGYLCRAVATPDEVTVDSFSAACPNTGIVASGLSNGQALAVQYRYRMIFPCDVRVIMPGIDFPLGQELLTLHPAERKREAIG